MNINECKKFLVENYYDKLSNSALEYHNAIKYLKEKEEEIINCKDVEDVRYILAEFGKDFHLSRNSNVYKRYCDIMDSKQLFLTTTIYKLNIIKEVLKDDVALDMISKKINIDGDYVIGLAYNDLVSRSLDKDLDRVKIKNLISCSFYKYIGEEITKSQKELEESSDDLEKKNIHEKIDKIKIVTKNKELLQDAINSMADKYNKSSRIPDFSKNNNGKKISEKIISDVYTRCAILNKTTLLPTRERQLTKVCDERFMNVLLFDKENYFLKNTKFFKNYVDRKVPKQDYMIIKYDGEEFKNSRRANMI